MPNYDRINKNVFDLNRVFSSSKLLIFLDLANSDRNCQKPLAAIASHNYLQQNVASERTAILSLSELKPKQLNTIFERAYDRRVEIEFSNRQQILIIFAEQDSDLQSKK